jgi:hypothetical protein
MPDAESMEAIDEATGVVLACLTEWQRASWRELATLADGLHYLAEQIRDVSQARSMDQLREMHRAGVG